MVLYLNIYKRIKFNQPILNKVLKRDISTHIKHNLLLNKCYCSLLTYITK